jgi:hypothetical protein
LAALADRPALRDAIPKTFEELDFWIAGITFSNPILAVERIPQLIFRFVTPVACPV